MRLCCGPVLQVGAGHVLAEEPEAKGCGAFSDRDAVRQDSGAQQPVAEPKTPTAVQSRDKVGFQGMHTKRECLARVYAVWMTTRVARTSPCSSARIWWLV